METGGKIGLSGLVKDAYRLARDAGKSVAVPAAVFVIAAGVYGAVLSAGSGWGGLVAGLVVFAAGIVLSVMTYEAMLGADMTVPKLHDRQFKGFFSGIFNLLGLLVLLVPAAIASLIFLLIGVKSDQTKARADLLIRTNLAIYVVFVFVGFFLAFFLSLLPGFLIMAMGREMDGETPPDVMQTYFLEMMQSPYGIIYGVFVLLAALALGFLAVRLLLAGAATVHRGQTHIFRTWGWTKDWALTLGLAAMATHILPFLLPIGVNFMLIRALGISPGIAGAFGISALGAALLLPFLLAGHGLAVSAYGRLAPRVSV